MLARPNRLRFSRDIARVYKAGRFGGAKHLSVKTLVRQTADSRAVVIVGKKVSKKAVVRNRLRRRLSDLLAKDWQHIRPCCDIVVTVNTDASDLSPAELGQQLSQALQKSGASTK